MSWSRAHWLVGATTLLLFLLAGVYMRHVIAVPRLADAPRLVYRSRFLFLLLIAVANIALSYARPERVVERIVSAIVLLAPVPLLMAFFLEPDRGVRGGPWTTWTMRGLFAAGVLLLFAHRPRRDQA